MTWSRRPALVKRPLLLVRVVLWTLLAPALSRLPPRRLVSLLGRGPRPTACSDEAAALRVVGALRRSAAVRRPDGDCLARSIALFRILGGRLDLVFGAGLVDDVLRGHAWLERDDVAWLERVDPTTWCQEMFRVRGVPR